MRFLLSENVCLEDTNDISLWQARIWPFLYPTNWQILGPAKIYLKSVFQATFSHFGNQTAK